jgi:glycine C-acetyltransferase
LFHWFLGKALGGASGGYTSASQEIVDMLRQKSRPYLFSNSIPPAVVGAAMGAFDVVESEEGEQMRRRLQDNMKYFRREMIKAGFELRGADHPIVPVMTHDARLAQLVAEDMLKEGVYVVGFFYPVVPQNKARIRVQLSAAHTRQDIQRAIDAFIKAGLKHGILKIAKL